MRIQPFEKGPLLVMDATVRTFRYLDPEEVAQQRAAAARKGAQARAGAPARPGAEVRR
jgi:hypothetical protein